MGLTSRQPEVPVQNDAIKSAVDETAIGKQFADASGEALAKCWLEAGKPQEVSSFSFPPSKQALSFLPALEFVPAESAATGNTNFSRSNQQEVSGYEFLRNADLQLFNIDRKKQDASQVEVERVSARAESNLGSYYRGRYVPEQDRNTLISEALRLSGHPATPSEIKWARALVSCESSFHAGQVNNWDSNAGAGYPSRGWAQVISPTFATYHVRGYGDIMNPVHNLAAGIRYADATYGYLDPSGNGLRWVAAHRSMRGLGY
jgi:hypothetical protein